RITKEQEALLWRSLALSQLGKEPFATSWLVPSRLLQGCAVVRPSDDGESMEEAWLKHGRAPSGVGMERQRSSVKDFDRQPIRFRRSSSSAVSSVFRSSAVTAVPLVPHMRKFGEILADQ